MHGSMQKVLVKAAGDDADHFVYSTQFFSFATHESLPTEEENSRAPTTCTVQGCGRPFPSSHPHGWNITIPEPGPVCEMHRKLSLIHI